MTQASIITDTMRDLIGIESEPSIYEIEKAPIRRWAEAIEDPNPLYHDEAYARNCGFEAIIAPPAFLGNYAYPIKGTGVPPYFILSPESPFSKNLAGGNEYEFFEPVQAGDTITAISKLVDLFERQGRPGIGRMLFQIIETTYRNQKDEVVVRTRRTDILYEGPAEEGAVQRKEADRG